MRAQEDNSITTEAAKRSHDILTMEQGSLRDRAVAADTRARVATEKLAGLQVSRRRRVVVVLLRAHGCERGCAGWV